MDYSSFFLKIGAIFGFVTAGAVSLCAGPVWAQSAAQVDVQVQSLSQVEPFRVGARSGVPVKMPLRQWRNTDVDAAIYLMSDLPEAGSSPLMNRLVASVLMSPSNPPVGGSGDSVLASLRLASVYRLGQLEAVIDLVERSSGGLSDPENAAIATQAFLALGREGEACETATRLQNGRAAVFWLKVRAFCFAREGRVGAAELTAGLVLEADPEDVDFLLSLNRMVTKDTEPVRPTNSLELAMARFAGAPIDLSEAPFALNSALVGTDGLVGLEAARRVSTAGVVKKDILERIYMTWPGLPNEETVQNSVQNSGQDSGTEVGTGDAAEAKIATEISGDVLLTIALAAPDDARAALVYQSAVRARTPGELAQAVYKGLQQEGEFGGFFAAAQLYAPLLEKLPASEILHPRMRQYFTYALLAAGKPILAKAFAKREDAATARLLALYFEGTKSPIWTLTDSEITQSKTARFAYTDLMALMAVGVPLQASHRGFLFSHVADTEEFVPCAPAARAVIAGGAEQQIRAASLLRSALLLADSGFDQAAPECGTAVVHALLSLGYKDLARQGALEMMLGPRLRHLGTMHE